MDYLITCTKDDSRYALYSEVLKPKVLKKYGSLYTREKNPRQVSLIKPLILYNTQLIIMWRPFNCQNIKVKLRKFCLWSSKGLHWVVISKGQGQDQWSRKDTYICLWWRHCLTWTLARNSTHRWPIPKAIGRNLHNTVNTQKVRWGNWRTALCGWGLEHFSVSGHTNLIHLRPADLI